MHLFKKNPDGLTLRRHLERIVDTTIRLGIVMLFAVPCAALCIAFWYYALYRNGIYFIPAAENITVASWVPFVGVFFIFVLTPILGKAWEKDTALNDAIHSYDFEKFMQLRVTRLHPMGYALLYLVGAATLGAYMAIDYPDISSGFVIVGSISYLVCFAPFVLGEVDKPLSGVWYIKNVPPEWMEISPKEWFRKTREERRAELLAKLKETEAQSGAVKEE